MPEPVAVEDIVAEHHCHIVAADEFLADYESLSKPVGVLLHGI